METVHEPMSSLPISICDDDLVQAACGGDERAHELLYRRYANDIRALCARMLRDGHAAEDVTQETFIRAFGNLHRFDRSRPVWPWLATIAKRLCVDELRKIARRSALDRDIIQGPDVAVDVTSEEAVDRVERQRIGRVVGRALADLRPRDRRVFEQAIDGVSHEEIARRDGMTIHAVRNLAWRARRALRRSLVAEREHMLGGFVAVWTAVRRRIDAAARKTWRARRLADVALPGGSIEPFAAVVLGLAASVAVFAGPAALSGTPVRMRANHRLGVAVRDGSATTTPPAGPRVGSRNVSPPPPTTNATVGIAPREPGAAAPSGASLTVEVSVGGREVLWYRNDARCGGQGARVMPAGGPVTVVC